MEGVTTQRLLQQQEGYEETIRELRNQVSYVSQFNSLKCIFSVVILKWFVQARYLVLESIVFLNYSSSSFSIDTVGAGT